MFKYIYSRLVMWRRGLICWGGGGGGPLDTLELKLGFMGWLTSYSSSSGLNISWSAADLALFLRINKNARKPMRARPTTPPTTPPAIAPTLLEDPELAASDKVGVAEGVVKVVLEVLKESSVVVGKRSSVVAVVGT
ncbi:hypothetical protein A0J61_02172 [Choanephora cucurbitarum]|uniref:Uncharacterized protein n=1 Tax=Choanephora cucurbitarum TaxID=101091 RepID=A0A1C7NLQ9_9FUNG|nr:hypothetical protein A0J61_02172 [Choanephora cucurbitarum]